MDKVKIYQVDAFTDRLFSGNPAAVCVLREWMDEKLMQSIANENNLSETAFVVSKKDHFEIRWFTPTLEVDLCGHATLASAFVLFNCLQYNDPEITFQSRRSGILKVSKQEDILFLDFPADIVENQNITDQLRNCFEIKPLQLLKGKTDYIVVLEKEEDVINLNPIMAEISKLNARGLIVTAKGNEVDFVSRFFAPQSGIDEDPVTGSAHTSLIPLWSQKLGKNKMIARQVSKRGGELICINNGERCLIGGKAKLYMIGEINLK